MGSSFPIYWIPLLPLLGAAINLLVGRKLPRGAVNFVACFSVLAALVVSMVGVFFHLYPEWVAATHGLPEGTLAPNPRIVNDVFDWIVAGEVNIHFGLVLDPLSAVMILVVTFVGFLIHLYSTGYMSNDPDYARFFAYMNLFMGAMLILVLGDNLVVLFVGWEGVGACSYLLIGFWYDKSGTQNFGDENATAGKKAFIVNRIGDFAFVLGMLILFWATGTLNVEEMATKVDQLTTTWTPLGLGTVSVAGAAALMLFIGATGKSAQIPLYVWLPDAMAGPTPVSALIHAATMVTAGVYMVVRLNFIYMLSPIVLGIIAVVGALTAFLAATIGFAQNDIKRVLAYSTVSQLGYMFIGAGVAAFSASIFHLFTHAFFKACLFLGSGAVIHALAGEQDMRNMGGLRKKMPVTHMTMLASTLAIAGFIGFSGFFSKDEILWKAIVTSNAALPFWLLKGVYVLALAGALCTAFYMFRLYFMTFSGDCRASDATLAKFHPPGWNITAPLAVLAVGAVGLGVLGLPEVLSKHNFFHHWLAPVVDRGLHIAMTSGYLAAAGMQPVQPDPTMAANHGLEGGLMVLSFGIALLGIIIARHYYNNDTTPQLRAIVDKIPRLHKWVYNKYYVDEFYGKTVILAFKQSASFCFKFVDKVIIDIVLVNGSAKVVDTIGKTTRWLQTGHLQHYIAVLVIGLVVLLYWVSQPPDDFTISPDGPVTVGEKVVFDAGRPNYDRRKLEYRWDFNGDGVWDHPQAAKGDESEAYTTSSNASFVYDKPGDYKVVLEVRDLRWHTKATAAEEIEVQGAAHGRLRSPPSRERQRARPVSVAQKEEVR